MAMLMSLTVMSLLIAPSTAGYAFIYDTGYREDGFKRHYAGLAERCYSFSCWSDEVSYISYQRTQHNAWMIFFEKPGFQGERVSHYEHGDSVWFSESGLDNKISSMMVWESGMYLMRGLVNLCPDESAPLFRNVSNGRSNPHDSRDNHTVVGGRSQIVENETGVVDAASFTTRV